MDKQLAKRVDALVSKAGLDPKNIDGLVDAVSPDDADIKRLVEKIMAKMDAEEVAKKYNDSKREAAFKKATALLKVAFDNLGDDSLTPVDLALGETPEKEAHDVHNSTLAPVEMAENEASKMNDPAIETLLHVVEMLINKDQAGKSEKAPFAEATPAPAFPPKAEEPKEEEVPAPAVAVEVEKKEALPFGDDKKEDEESAPKEDESKEEDKSEDKKDDKEEKSLEVEARARVKELLSLPVASRLAKAAKFRKVAEMLESGETPAFLEEEKNDKKDDNLDKEAAKNALRAALAALEGDANDETNELPAKPEERAEKQEELAKEASAEDRKAKLIAHVAKLRMQKEATVDGKSMATPKEVPSPSGTVEDNLKGDAPVEYSRALGADPGTESFSKKEKLPTDKTHGDEAEVYFGNNPEAKTEVQTEKDSSKDVNNKRQFKDMSTHVQPDHPVSPTESEAGAGTHQKEKSWEAAKAESDKTPTGPGLVGIASAIALARVAQAKGMIATEAQFDELVTKYASYDTEKFAMAQEIIDSTPSVNPNVVAARLVEAESNDVSDYSAVEDAVEEKTEKKANRAPSVASQAIRTISASRELEPARKFDSELTNKIASLGWETPLTKIAEKERMGLNLDSKTSQ